MVLSFMPEDAANDKVLAIGRVIHYAALTVAAVDCDTLAVGVGLACHRWPPDVSYPPSALLTEEESLAVGNGRSRQG